MDLNAKFSIGLGRKDNDSSHVSAIIQAIEQVEQTRMNKKYTSVKPTLTISDADGASKKRTPKYDALLETDLARSPEIVIIEDYQNDESFTDAGTHKHILTSTNSRQLQETNTSKQSEESFDFARSKAVFEHDSKRLRVHAVVQHTNSTKVTKSDKSSFTSKSDTGIKQSAVRKFSRERRAADSEIVSSFTTRPSTQPVVQNTASNNASATVIRGRSNSPVSETIRIGSIATSDETIELKLTVTSNSTNENRRRSGSVIAATDVRKQDDECIFPQYCGTILTSEQQQNVSNTPARGHNGDLLSGTNLPEHQQNVLSSTVKDHDRDSLSRTTVNHEDELVLNPLPSMSLSNSSKLSTDETVSHTSLTSHASTFDITLDDLEQMSLKIESILINANYLLSQIKQFEGTCGEAEALNAEVERTQYELDGVAGHPEVQPLIAMVERTLTLCRFCLDDKAIYLDTHAVSVGQERRRSSAEPIRSVAMRVMRLNAINNSDQMLQTTSKPRHM